MIGRKTQRQSDGQLLADVEDVLLVDSGKTWSSPVELPFVDRQAIAVDRTGGEYHGRIYINGTAGIDTVAGAPLPV